VTELIKILALLFSSSGTYTKSIPVCERDVSHLSLETKIEVAIGCSTVNGRKVYLTSNIERLIDEQV
jgi:hypothetical protein